MLCRKIIGVCPERHSIQTNTICGQNVELFMMLNPGGMKGNQKVLTFWSLTTYIYIYMSYRSANLQTLHFKYLFNEYTYWIF